jgi:hypothetical protein
MAERRSLVAGLKTTEEVDPELAKQFIYGEKPAKQEINKPQAAGEGRDSSPQNSVTRAPLTTRIRADFVTSLKRASLERQLSGEVPNTIVDILEDALEPWLRSHGYVP